MEIQWRIPKASKGQRIRSCGAEVGARAHVGLELARAAESADSGSYRHLAAVHGARGLTRRSVRDREAGPYSIFPTRPGEPPGPTRARDSGKDGISAASFSLSLRNPPATERRSYSADAPTSDLCALGVSAVNPRPFVRGRASRPALPVRKTAGKTEYRRPIGGERGANTPINGGGCAVPLPLPRPPPCRTVSLQTTVPV